MNRRYSYSNYLFPRNPATISGIPSIVREVFKNAYSRRIGYFIVGNHT
jgi:hypothetical protein